MAVIPTQIFRAQTMSAFRTNRRDFLRTSVASVAVGSTFEALTARLGRANDRQLSCPGYGPLRPVADATTGLELLHLPEGFRYLSYGWTGDEMEEGRPTPAAHDGMAVISDHDGVIILARNHEINEDGPAIGPAAITYDQRASAGCTNLMFDTNTGEWIKSWVSLSGTVRNCAGGPTPWGTWLTCEETTLGPGEEYEGTKFNYEQTHGWIFEVPATGDADPRPLKAMGRIWHEAVAVDPATGIVYETEDRDDSGIYRFLPNTPGRLREGGRLQMLCARGHRQLKKGLQVGQTFDVTWVDIEDPERADSPGTSDHQGVYHQGRAAGGATFARLEGAWFGNGRVYVTATSGGAAERGQVFEYDPHEETLTLIFESPGMHLLDMPDNMCVSPRGGIVLCEDGDVLPQRIQGLTPDGRVFPFVANGMDLRSLPARHQGRWPSDRIQARDYRAEEMCGATFNRNGQWLFVNLQDPGLTVAITGPWADGLI